ncbi:MAG: bacillithiol biosynthesis BshC, partial [Bacteroidota bacterium]
DRLSSQAQSLEGGLVKAMEAGKVRSLAILDQMGSKFRKAEERRLEVDLGRARAVLEYVSPGGTPQERVLNLMNFSLENPHFIEDLMSSFDPFDFSMMILDLE